MGYIQAAKYAAILALIIGAAVWFERDGYQRAENKWKLKAQADLIKQTEEINKLNAMIHVHSEESTRQAQTSEAHYHEAQNKINQLSLANAKLLSTAGVRKRAVCTKDRASKSDGAGSPIDESPKSGLSTEAERLLFLEMKRADDAAIYANIAYQWATNLCKLPNVVCPTSAPDKPVEPATPASKTETR